MPPNQREAKIPNTIDRAFRYCSYLQSVEIPASVTSIGKEAFDGCSGLTEIVVDGNNRTYHAKGNCLIETGSRTLIFGCQTSIIPDDGSVTSIGESAFEYCSGLTSITIPDSVTEIGEEAFRHCDGLQSVTFGDNSKLTSIGAYAFSSCSGLASIDIPDSVTEIEESAFAYCSGLTSVTIGSGSIGEYAFYKCSGLTSVTIGSGVTSIGERAFWECDGLTSVTIPANVTTIGVNAFRECDRLKNVSFMENSKLTLLEVGVFLASTALQSVEIPASVTTIDNAVFRDCRSLTEIRYKGTISSWKQIQKGNWWDSNTGKYTVYCTDGTITKDGKETYYNNAQSVSAYVAVTPRKREF